MSARRVVFSGAIVIMLLVTGGWYASEAFPVVVQTDASNGLQATPSSGVETDQVPTRPITPENPIPRRLFSTPIPYPLELNGTGLEGAVDLRVRLDESGRVTVLGGGAFAVSTPGAGVSISRQDAMDIFRTTAADAIRRWQYAPPAEAPIAFWVGVTFRPGSPATASQSEIGRGVRAGADGVRLLNPGEGIAGFGAPPQAPGGARSGGPRPVTQAPAPGTVHAETTISVPPRQAQSGDVAPLRVGSAVNQPLQTRKVDPVYPLIARSARVSGVVILEVTVDEQGNVQNPRVLRSIPLLDQAAIDAVSQWQYQPVLLNGAPVPVIMTVTIEFRPEF